MKRIMSVAALVLAGTTLTACGGGAPTDASESDFCDSLETAFTVIGEVDTSDDNDEDVDLSEAIDALEETGTPEDMPDDARESWETLLDALKDADGKTPSEIEDDVDDPFDDDEGDAFGEYYSTTCLS